MISLDVSVDAQAAGRAAAVRIGQLIEAMPRAVIGVATGSSPLPVYAHLARLVADGLDVGEVRWFALDEYVGLPPRHPASFRHVLERELLAPLGADPALLHVPDGSARDLDAAAADYERDITDAGGIDLQLLGIGTNGHVGFNEPKTPFDSRTHPAWLAPQTRQANARFFGGRVEDVPRRCLTQGLATIMRSRAIELIATGAHKAAAVCCAVLGPVTVECPASVLQTHPDVTFRLDVAAACQVQVSAPSEPNDGTADSP